MRFCCGGYRVRWGCVYVGCDLLADLGEEVWVCGDTDEEPEDDVVGVCVHGPEDDEDDTASSLVIDVCGV